MFYVKRKVGCTTIKTPITSHNVFCQCPRCGQEVPIDLDEYFNEYQANDDSYIGIDRPLNFYCAECNDLFHYYYSKLLDPQREQIDLGIKTLTDFFPDFEYRIYDDSAKKQRNNRKHKESANDTSTYFDDEDEDIEPEF